MADLFIALNIPVDPILPIQLETNVKSEHVTELICDFIRGQTGKGKDPSEPNIKDSYHIRLDIDLSEDIFTCRHDCGNLGLRDGLLMDAINRLKPTLASDAVS